MQLEEEDRGALWATAPPSPLRSAKAGGLRQKRRDVREMMREEWDLDGGLGDLNQQMEPKLLMIPIQTTI